MTSPPPERRHRRVQSSPFSWLCPCVFGTYWNTVSVVFGGFHLCLCILRLYKHLCCGMAGDAAAASVAFRCCSIRRCMIGTVSLALAWLQGRVLTNVSDGPCVIVPLSPLQLSAFFLGILLYFIVRCCCECHKV